MYNHGMLAIRGRIRSYVTIIRNHRYRPLWLGQLVSSLGDILNCIALRVYVYQLTGSGIDVSKLSLFQLVPIILIAPLGHE